MFIIGSRLILSLFVCAFGSEVFGDVIYALDDGTFESQNGRNTPGLKSIVAIHRYNVSQNANIITSIQVAWPSVGLINGDPATVVLWNDPNLDGNPTDAQVLASVASTIQFGGTGTFVTIDIPDTLVGDSFFVGTVIEKNTTGFVAGRLVDLSPPFSGQAWFAGFVGASADLNNLSSGVSFGNDVDKQYSIRAVGVSVPEPPSVSLCMLGLFVLRRRHDYTVS